MPNYLYRREDGSTFEYRQKFSDDPLETCPTTGQPVHRVPQASGVIFKGTGFYVNDSKGSKKTVTTPAASGDSASHSEGSGDSATSATSGGEAAPAKEAAASSDGNGASKTSIAGSPADTTLKQPAKKETAKK